METITVYKGKHSPLYRIFKSDDPFFDGEIVVKQDVIKGWITFEKPSIDWRGKIYNSWRSGSTGYLFHFISDLEPGVYKIHKDHTNDFRRIKLIENEEDN